MIRIVIFVFLCGMLLVHSGCQSYTSGLQESTTRTDETTAIGALHAIAQAERTYSVSNEGNYGTLAQLSSAGYLDSRFAGDKPLKDYSLKLTVNSGSSPGYTCNADPADGRPGRHFFLDSNSGVIHVNETQTASASDPAIQ